MNDVKIKRIEQKGKLIKVKFLSRLFEHDDVNSTYNIYVHLYEDGFDEMYSVRVSEK